MKRCFKCGVTKPLIEFYAHPQMADGHLNKCKDCTRRDATENRAARREQYSRYEQERFRRPKRKAQMQQTRIRRKARDPQRDKAWNAVSNALRDRRLQRGPCEYCGTTINVQTHHDDYSHPLDVRWLCFKCHREHVHGQVVVVL